jgi:hypothetical protein
MARSRAGYGNRIDGGNGRTGKLTTLIYEPRARLNSPTTRTCWQMRPLPDSTSSGGRDGSERALSSNVWLNDYWRVASHPEPLFIAHVRGSAFKICADCEQSEHGSPLEQLDHTTG